MESGEAANCARDVIALTNWAKAYDGDLHDWDDGPGIGSPLLTSCLDMPSPSPSPPACSPLWSESLISSSSLLP
jgi:hypothetical protein